MRRLLSRWAGSVRVRANRSEADSAGRSSWLRYGVAVLAVGMVLLAKLLLNPLITQQSPFLLMAGAVMVGAWFGGFGPGLLATVLGALSADYFFLEPVGSFTGLGVGFLPFILFVLQGLLISALVEALHSARRRAEESMVEAQSHQERLRESEERYRVVTKTASDAIIAIDEDSRILFINSAAEKIFGYARAEMIGQRLTMLMPDRLREVHEASFESYLETGRRRLDWGSIRLPGLHKSGKEIPLEISFGEFVREGEHIFTGFVRDITERKEAEEALHQSEELYRNVVEQAEENIFIVDIETRCIVEANAAFHRLLGYAPEELKEMTLYDVVAHDQQSVDRNIQSILQEGRRHIGERKYRRKDGSLAEMEVSASAISYEGGKALCVVAHDITERKKAEKELHVLVGRMMTAQEEERRRVAYDIHDGFTQMAATAYRRLQTFMEHRAPEAAQDRQELEDAVALVQRTVGEARRIIANLRPTTLDDFGLATAIRMQLEELRSEGFDASYEETLGEERLPATLETALFRVVQEALANVRKHAQTDRLRVALGRHGGFVRLEVMDWGRGFEPAEVEDGGGPGERVGLSSMRKRIGLLGGSLKIRSEPEAGTTVVAEVPLPTTGEEVDGGR